MTVQKVIPKDPQKESEKYLIFLDYTLDKLRKGRPAGISLRNIASDYKSEMGTLLSYDDQKEFMRLYDGVHFDKAEKSNDRIIIKNKAIRILLKYGSMRDYSKHQANKNYAKKLFDFEFNSFWVWTGRISSLIAVVGLLIKGCLFLYNITIGQVNMPIEKHIYQTEPRNVPKDTINVSKTDTLYEK